MAEIRTPEQAYRDFCNGEQTAFDEIMDAFRQSLIYFLYGLVHDPDIAEDLAEDAFVELLVHRGRYRFQSSLKTFLFSVARHKAIDHIRREKRRNNVSFDEIIEQPASSEDIAAELAASIEAEKLRAAMADLPNDYRTAIHLLYIENLSYEEIARVMNKNKKQVDNLVYRAKGALRDKLGKDSLFEERLKKDS
ncbi:MAG: RNA polymerase sigma factor [Oscillospiraceae bacterium]|jgi:RNA polymerase sigma-70 factor (ECF subfamily)|nr:RNA polymerase sigma factor [Oscillospiraceae bacterium]